MNGVTDKSGGLRTLLRTLSSRNYRLFFAGQGISLIGTWMQQVAISWLVYRLTGSELLLGVVSFATRIPIFFLSPFMGVFADRWNRHRILLVTQALSMLQASTLAALVLSEHIEVWHLVLLGLFLGVVNALDTPARQSFIVDMIEKREDLGNAIALNSSLVNGARLLGPSIAGVVISIAGEGICFLLNAASFVAVIAALLAMKISREKKERTERKARDELIEGARYVFGFAPMRQILFLVSVVSLMGMPFQVLMPVFAKDILGGGPDNLGLLMGAAGLGALIGAIYLASRKTVLGLGRFIVISCLLFGLGLMGFAYSRVFIVSMALMVIAGFGMICQLASSNTVLQTIVEDDKRGRLMSFYTMSFLGIAPFGALLAGTLASRIGAPNTVFAGGVTCVIGALWFMRKLPSIRRLVRPIYVKKGIILEVASGISMATEPADPHETRHT